MRGILGGLFRPCGSSVLSLIVFLTYLTVIVTPEIIELDIAIDASSDEVHFVRGYLQAPASIDLSAVTFLTTAEPDFVFEDDEYEDVMDDDNTGNDNDNIGTEIPTTSTDDDSTEIIETDPPTAAPEVVTPAPETTPISTVAPATQDSENPEIPAENDNDNNNQDDIPAETPAPQQVGEASEPQGNVEPAVEETSAPAVNKTAAPVPDEAKQTTDPPAGGDGGDRRRELEGTKVSQIMDIILFRVPADCSDTFYGTCEWAKLGVGVYDDEMEGGMSYCCSSDTAGRGLCNEQDIGTLMVDHSIFDGDHRTVEVPKEPNKEFRMDDGAFGIETSGDYVLVIANCNDYGLQVLALGNMEWKSVGGYLPGDQVGFMYFYGCLMVIYFIMALWYYCGMRIYQDAAIPIQKYILATIILGFLEVTFRSADLVILNFEGIQVDGITYTAMALAALKRGSSRCLGKFAEVVHFYCYRYENFSHTHHCLHIRLSKGVMVAMGYGVVRDTLGTALVKIMFLGLLYTGLVVAQEFFYVAAEDVQTISITEKEELLDLALILVPVIFVVNMIFYFWIISSLNSTAEYLRNMNQTTKLARHLRLRCIIVTSLTIVTIWYV